MFKRDFLTKLDVHYDLAKIRADVNHRYDLFGEDNVVLVNSHPESKEPLKDFSGWLPDEISEDDFTIVRVVNGGLRKSGE